MNSRLLQQISDKAEVSCRINGEPAYYHVPAKLIEEFRAIDFETITMSKALFNRFVLLYHEADYQLRYKLPSIENLATERDKLSAILAKEFPDIDV